MGQVNANDGAALESVASDDNAGFESLGSSTVQHPVSANKRSQGVNRKRDQTMFDLELVSEEEEKGAGPKASRSRSAPFCVGDPFESDTLG